MKRKYKDLAAIASAAIVVTLVTFQGLMKPEVGYPVALAILFLGCCARVNYRPIRFVGITGLWLITAVFALLVVPDAEEAVRTNQAGLNWWAAGIASYLLFMSWYVRRKDRGTAELGAEQEASRS